MPATVLPQSWNGQAVSLSAKRLSVSQEEVSVGVGFHMKFCRLCVGSLFPEASRIMYKLDSSLKLFVLTEQLK
jgi:hypothetical protein